MLQCVAVCCDVLIRRIGYTQQGLLQCIVVCCSVLHCAAFCCSVLQCVAVCCNMLQCVADCGSVLQCVAVCCIVFVREIGYGVASTGRLLKIVGLFCKRTR